MESKYIKFKTVQDIIQYLLTKKTFTNNYICQTYGSTSQFIKKTRWGKNVEQTGGTKPEFTVEFKGNVYQFYKNHLDDDIYVLYSMDPNDDTECVVIEVNSKYKKANIQNLSGIRKCVSPNINNVGSTLLKITLKLLINLNKKNQNKYNIEIITLSDDSEKICPANHIGIEMQIMNVLRTGDTWYGAYGFRPFLDLKKSNDSVVIHEIYNKTYEKNKEIMATIKLGDINILKYFKKAKQITPDQLYAIDKIIKINPDMLVKDFINKFLRKFDNTCGLFSQFYIQLYNDLGLKRTGTLYGLFLTQNNVKTIENIIN